MTRGRGRVRGGWVGLSVAVVMHTVAAGAQDVTREARGLFEQGVAASDAGRYAEAVQLFERSQQLRASPVVLRNLAVAYRGVGRLIDASRAFEQYFANPGARATAEDLTRLRAERDAIVAEIPELRFEVSPSSATISIDGRALGDRGAPLRIDPGIHVIEATAEDFSPQRIELNVQRGERRVVSVSLAQRAADGRVAIETNVPNAQLELDGARVGTQTADVAATPGSHTLVVSAPGYRPLRRAVTVGRHGTARVSVVLQRTPGFPAWATATIVGGSLVAVGVASWIIVDRTRDPFVPPSGPNYWGEVAFPP
jgi:hypothetical protein